MSVSAAARTSGPLPTIRLVRLSMSLLLPAMLVNITVSNQPWMLGPLRVSQPFVFWPMIFFAIVVVFSRFGKTNVWPWFLVLGLFGSRIFGLNDAEGLRRLLYVVPLHALFVAAGAIIAIERWDLLLKQIRVYFILSIPFMILQMSGAGSWTLALNTETTAVAIERAAEARLTSPTLFVPPGEGSPAIGQRRPAGFMHANNMLSLAILLGLALQLGRIRSRRLTWTDLLFCAAMVLAMAKIVALGFVLMASWKFLRGPGFVRWRIVRIGVATVLLLVVYQFFWPGLYAHNFNTDRLFYSTMIRVNDLVATLDQNSPILDFLGPYLTDTPTLTSEENSGALSGYGHLMRADWSFYTAVVVCLLALVMMRRAIRRLKRSPGLTAAPDGWPMLLTVLVFPAAVPIWRSPLYWLMVGIAMSPVISFYMNRRRVSSRQQTRRWAAQQP
jgi:hypothetical protein